MATVYVWNKYSFVNQAVYGSTLTTGTSIVCKMLDNGHNAFIFDTSTRYLYISTSVSVANGRFNLDSPIAIDGTANGKKVYSLGSTVDAVYMMINTTSNASVYKLNYDQNSGSFTIYWGSKYTTYPHYIYDILNYNMGSISTVKGSTSYGTVESENRSAYNDNGITGNYWYVYSHSYESGPEAYVNNGSIKQIQVYAGYGGAVRECDVYICKNGVITKV